MVIAFDFLKNRRIAKITRARASHPERTSRGFHTWTWCRRQWLVDADEPTSW